MSGLEFDDRMDEHEFRHTVEGYGAVITGGSPDEREAALRNHIDGPFTVVDCRGISSGQEFEQAVLQDAKGLSEENAKRVAAPSAMDVSRALAEADTDILLLEFDSMEFDVQRIVAQIMKGVAERREWDGSIGYSCEDGEAVIQAQGDLSLRVKTWSLDE